MSDLKKIPLVECFGPVIQGEGAVTGKISYFLRFGGCTYRCSWCDSLHAVDPQQIKEGSQHLAEIEIIDKLTQLVGLPEKPLPQGTYVTLTGGDPCIWDLNRLCTSLFSDGWRIAVETQGAFYTEWLKSCDVITVSPKGPSSGMADKLNWPTLEKYARNLSGTFRHHGLSWERLNFKVVCFSKYDISFAEEIHAKFPNIPMYLSAGTPQPTYEAKEIRDKDANKKAAQRRVLNSYSWLAQEVLDVHPLLHDTTILPQMHVLLHGYAKGV